MTSNPLLWNLFRQFSNVPLVKDKSKQFDEYILSLKEIKKIENAKRDA